MAHFLILISVSVIFVSIQVINCQIEEPQQYTATTVPKDPTSIRQALGYNKYDGRDVKDTDKTIVYGNNWELFDTESNANGAQNQYFGNQPRQPYRYYRSVYYS